MPTRYSCLGSVLAAFAVMTMIGCEGEPAGTGAPPPPPQSSATTAAHSETAASADLPALDPKEIEVATVDVEGFKAKLKELEGKVVLVDFWANWCTPCKKNFPHTAELARQHAKDGLVMVSVSLDDEDALDDVRRFLATQRAKGPEFVNLLSSHGGNDSFDKFEIESGAIPYYCVYDRSGKLTAKLPPNDADVAFELSSIDEAVSKALEER